MSLYQMKGGGGGEDVCLIILDLLQGVELVDSFALKLNGEGSCVNDGRRGLRIST